MRDGPDRAVLAAPRMATTTLSRPRGALRAQPLCSGLTRPPAARVARRERPSGQRSPPHPPNARGGGAEATRCARRQSTQLPEANRRDILIACPGSFHPRLLNCPLAGVPSRWHFKTFSVQLELSPSQRPELEPEAGFRQVLSRRFSCKAT